jgi:glycosyltransferase involved in cell wall biosynthesis
MRPLISVIMPVYNASAFLPASLGSVLSQSYPQMELILVNDASTDDSVQVLERLLAQHPRREAVRLLTHSVNAGPGGCRNTGIIEARGEYVFFMDSDDEIRPDCLEILVRPMEEFSYDYVLGSAETLDVATGSLRAYPQQACSVRSDEDMDYERLLEAYFRMVVWNKLYRRSFLLEHSLVFEPGIYHEDQLFLFRMAFCTRTYAVVPDVTYRYFKRQASITGSYSRKNYQDMALVIGRMVQMLAWLQQHPLRLKAARKHIFMLQCNVSMHVLESTVLTTKEQRGFVQSFGILRLPWVEYRTIPKGYWRDKIMFPAFYFSIGLSIFIYRIIQLCTRNESRI